MSVNFEYELKVLRSKLSRLLDVYAGIAEMAMPVTEWPFWVDKLSALAIQYQSLLKELKHTLESAIVEPTQATGNVDHIPSVLLRSKLTPEVEASALPLASSLENTMPPAYYEQVLQEFVELKESFDADLKALITSKQSATPPSEPAYLEQAIRRMYTGE